MRLSKIIGLSLIIGALLSAFLFDFVQNHMYEAQEQNSLLSLTNVKSCQSQIL